MFWMLLLPKLIAPNHFESPIDIFGSVGRPFLVILFAPEKKQVGDFLQEDAY